ncbi:MAG: NTP transferase domain-containing protein, partial [Methylophilaceae bacterium]|nr:NTP transferase domain-containing protein [Methylophilaceae bacterium]
MQNNRLNIIILAAGKGTRMHTRQPKVLHQIGGKPMLEHVINCANALNPHKVVVVYGYGGEQVKAAFSDQKIIWAEQAEQLGTGHAVQQALPHLDEEGQTLILLGDVPLISQAACQNILNQADQQLMIQSF